MLIDSHRPTTEPAPKPPVPKPETPKPQPEAAPPKDSVELSQDSQDELAQQADSNPAPVTRHIANPANRDQTRQLLEDLVVDDPDDPGYLSPQEREPLADELSAVDPDILRLLQREGVRIGAPDNLDQELDYLKEREHYYEPGALERAWARGDEVNDFARKPSFLFGGFVDSNLEARQAGLEAQIDRLHEQLGDGAVVGGATGKGEADPRKAEGLAQLADLNSQVADLEDLRRERLADRLERNDVPAVVIDDKIVTPQALAAEHGAETPEEVAQFVDLFGAVNGDRLAEAQDAALTRLQDQIDSNTDPRYGEFLERQLIDYQENPDKIPVVPLDHDLVAPDVFFDSLDGQRVSLDSKSLETRDLASGSVGLYLPGPNQIEVDQSYLGTGAATHEVGHAVDHLVERLDPDFYQDWSADLQEAYDAVGSGQSGAISDYSRTNLREYLADGFKFYHQQPDQLRQTDPALYELVDELTERAVELAA